MKLRSKFHGGQVVRVPRSLDEVLGWFI